ncbi:sulfite reductase flavoprotein subunit alpha [Chromatiaceae bacterium AAb-1]|nr:sulfite reductase flavoprotein subunit alpha [Chromatiaceae bacterium AAb-1]
MISGLAGSFWFKLNSRPVKPLHGFDWLEQTLALACCLMLLVLFYMPQAPFRSGLGQLSWLSCQLILLSLALRCWIYWRERTEHTEMPASSHLSSQQTWLVGYASQSGMAEQLARQSASQLQQAGFAVEVSPLNALSEASLLTHQRALFVVSTYGEGEPPDNASQFYKLAQQWPGTLDGLQFAVLALGDRSYQQFCAFGHWLYQWLAARQANPLQHPIELDSAAGNSNSITAWQHLLSKITNLQPAQQALEPSWQYARLFSRYRINPASPGLPCYVVKLQIPENCHWQAGDVVDIQPQNGKSTVALWLTRHNLNGCQPVQYQQQTMPLCWALGQLQLPDTPPARDEILEDWLSRQQLLPVRTYSIASVPAEGQITLLVRQVQKDQGALGIGSGWLTAWAPEMQPVKLRLRSHSNFHLPDDDRPVILIGNGTGIAGLRALLAERITRGHTQNWLLFGERKQETDFFFAKDIQQWQQQGFLAELDLVFSRDQAERRYVQHALSARITEVKAWLERGAAVYVCGSLEGMGGSVHQVLQDAIGQQQLTELQQQGRYRRDLY